MLRVRRGRRSRPRRRRGGGLSSFWVLCSNRADGSRQAAGKAGSEASSLKPPSKFGRRLDEWEGSCFPAPETQERITGKLLPCRLAAELRRQGSRAPPRLPWQQRRQGVGPPCLAAGEGAPATKRYEFGSLYALQRPPRGTESLRVASNNPAPSLVHGAEHPRSSLTSFLFNWEERERERDG